MRLGRAAVAAAVIGGSLAMPLARAAHAVTGPQTFNVTTTADSGPGSLRQAILDANANTNFQDLVNVDPGNGQPATIVLESDLPPITDGVRLIGLALPNNDGTGLRHPVVTIDGTHATSSGLRIEAVGILINLVITNFPGDGVTVDEPPPPPYAPAYGSVLGGIQAIGNGGHGIDIRHTGVAAIYGSVLSGNHGDGIRIEQGKARIGDLGAQNMNTVTGNGGNGITALPGARSRIGPNTFADNSGLAVDMGDDGVTAGAPDLSTPVTDGAHVVVTGIAHAARPFQTLTVEVFANAACDPSGSGEGERWVQEVYAIADANRVARFSAIADAPVQPGESVSALSSGEWFSDTASELSTCHAVAPAGPGLTGVDAAPWQYENTPKTTALAYFYDTDGNGDAASFHATVTWENGSTSQAVVNRLGDGVGSFMVSAPLSYPDEGLHHVTVSVTDSDGDQLVVPVELLVADALVTVSQGDTNFVIGQSWPEHEIVQVYDYAHPNDPSDLSATVDWGDGSPTEQLPVTNSRSSWLTVRAAHAYQSPGPFTLKVRVDDVGGASATSTQTVYPQWPGPIVANPTFVEGNTSTQTLMTIARTGDLADYHVTVDWGDGLPPSPGLVEVSGSDRVAVRGTHVFQDPRWYRATVSASGPNGLSVVQEVSIGVVDAPLTLTPAPLAPARAGVPYTAVLGHLTDADPGSVASDHHADVQWGDGALTPATVVASPGGGFDVVGTHTFQRSRASHQYAGWVSVRDVFASAGLNLQFLVVNHSSAAPAVYRSGAWLLRNTLDQGANDAYFTVGGPALPGDAPLMGDWDGDGIRTPGMKRGNTYYVRNSNNDGPYDWSFTFGLPTDKPVVGDWDGDGIESIGVYRAGFWELSSDYGASTAFHFQFGGPNDTPVAGDWNGDAKTTVGVVSGNEWKLRNANSAGAANIDFHYGNASDKPIVGDWDGDGYDTPGVVRGNTWLLRNSLSFGPEDINFWYGNASDTPLVWFF